MYCLQLQFDYEYLQDGRDVLPPVAVTPPPSKISLTYENFSALESTPPLFHLVANLANKLWKLNVLCERNFLVNGWIRGLCYSRKGQEDSDDSLKIFCKSPTFIQDLLSKCSLGFHFLDISWAYLGHILGIPWAYLGHTLGISWAYLGHILGMSWGYVGDMLGIS